MTNDDSNANFVPVKFNVVVAGFILRNVQEVLLVQRPSCSDVAPGIWHFPGGHMDESETTAEALKREIHEELGIQIRVGISYETFLYTAKYGNTHGVIHFAKTSADESLILDPVEAAAAKWVTEDEAMKLLSPNGDHNVRLCRLGFELLKVSPELCFPVDADFAGNCVNRSGESGGI